MTRKDYILIAEAIKQTADMSRSFADAEALRGARLTANHIATALGRDNPRFDRERFLKACDVA